MPDEVLDQFDLYRPDDTVLAAKFLILIIRLPLNGFQTKLTHYRAGTFRKPSG